MRPARYSLAVKQGYTPNNMPMKSEPFCIVIDAAAALSTNMEVYCPACEKENITLFKVDVNLQHILLNFMYLKGSWTDFYFIFFVLFSEVHL